LKPADIDDMVNRTFMKKDNLITVHQYTEMRLSNGKPPIGHRAPYERLALANGSRLLAALLSVACQSSAPGPDVGAPPQPAHAAQVRPQPEAPAAPTPPPATPAPLLDRVHDLAGKLSVRLTNEEVEERLDVHLAADASGFSGASRSWPVRVYYVPAAGDKAASLHLSFNDLGSVKLADLERRFGPADHHIDAKEGLATYPAPLGTRLQVKYLGGWNPSTPVSAIRLESATTKEPHLPDLF